MQNVHDQFTILRIAQDATKKVFLEAIHNKELPILERVSIWEEYAEKILPMGKWSSIAPEWVKEVNEGYLSRYQNLSFTDLLENIPDEELTFDADTEEVVGISQKGIEMIEEVFATEHCGTEIDW